MFRLISFSRNTSTAARQRSSVSAWMVTASSPAQLTLAPVPRKSNRVDNSLLAWFSALSTSCRSTLLTTSNDGSATCSHLHVEDGYFVADATRSRGPALVDVDTKPPASAPPRDSTAATPIAGENPALNAAADWYPPDPANTAARIAI